MDEIIATAGIIGISEKLLLSKERYDKLQKSMDALHSAFDIEQKFDILFNNFRELESEVLNETMNNMYVYDAGYSDLYDFISLINRRLANFLTSSKLYIDHIKQDIKVCLYMMSDAKEKLSDEVSKHYDECFDYRFMEALRNHVQHSGLPVHSISKRSRKSSKNEPEGYIYSVKVEIHKSKLDMNKRFKKSIINEMPDKIDCVLSVRNYMERLSHINDFVRKITGDELVKSRGYIEKALSEYNGFIKNNDSDITSLVCVSSINGIKNRFNIFLNWDDVRLSMINKRMSLSNLNNRYIISKIY